MEEEDKNSLVVENVANENSNLPNSDQEEEDKHDQEEEDKIDHDDNSEIDQQQPLNQNDENEHKITNENIVEDDTIYDPLDKAPPNFQLAAKHGDANRIK